jgi:large conductance mechanosensitive channel
MLKGFREFALKGNFIDLAVAVVVGAAVAALIGAISTGLILPLVGVFLGGGVDAGQIEINGQIIDITLIINAFIIFIITMAVIYFAFVVPMNKIRERMGQQDIAAMPADIALLTEIRDLLQAQQQGGTPPQPSSGAES